jgi:hypothetical protein
MQRIIIGLNTVGLGHLAATSLKRSQVWVAAALRAGVPGLWGVFLVIVGPRLVETLFGGGFELSRLQLAALTAAFMATAFYEFLALALRAAKEGRTLTRARAVGAVTILLLALVIGQSVIGIAMSIVMGQVVAILASLKELRNLPVPNAPWMAE